MKGNAPVGELDGLHSGIALLQKTIDAVIPISHRNERYLYNLQASFHEGILVRSIVTTTSADQNCPNPMF